VVQNSLNLFDTSQTNNSAQGDPKDNKPNKSSKPEDNNDIKSPIYPHTPVKVYIDANVSKSDITKDFKDVSIIYMWFNKITGRIYIGSAVNGSKRLATYYQPSILRKKSLIYQSILKYGHASFSVIILDNCGNTSTVSKDDILEREKFYLDWALKTYGLAVLNMLNIPGSSLGYKHTEESLLKMSELKKGDKNPMFNKPKSEAFINEQVRDKSGKNNPMYGKTKSDDTLAKLKKMIFVYDVTQNYKLLGVYPTVMWARIFKLCNNTLTKRIKNKEIHKGKYLFSKEPHDSEEV